MVAPVPDIQERRRRDDSPLPILAESVKATLEVERRRIMDEAGLNARSIQHFRRPAEKKFTKDERSRVTVWFGGLTMRHERLILAGLQGLGYQVGIVPTPDKTDFQAGREYGNNGQCNPTYFTVGSLVNHLKQMRDKDGLSTEEIIRDNVFITAGACGPCRFGMYEAEYRLALRNSGFDGFRVLLFQQGGGLDQAAVEAGLEFNLNFFLTLINAIFMGDVLNEVANQIRPYETVSGRTDETLDKCLKLCQSALRKKNYDEIHGGRLARILSRFVPVRDGDDVGKFIDQLRGTYYTDILDRCRRIIEDEVEVDFNAAPAHRQNHRGVLGSDDRRGRQLPDVPFSRGRGGGGPGRAGRHVDMLHAAPGREGRRGPPGSDR